MKAFTIDEKINIRTYFLYQDRLGGGLFTRAKAPYSPWIKMFIKFKSVNPTQPMPKLKQA